MKRLSQTLLVALAIVVGSGIGNRGGAAEVQDPAAIMPLKFGLSVPLSGPWTSWGHSLAQGVQLATRQASSNLDVDIQDDRCQIQDAVSNMRKFTSIDRLKVIFVGCVEVLDAVAPIAASAGAIILTLGGMDKGILKRHHNIISMNPLSNAESFYIASYFNSRPDLGRISIIHGINSFGIAMGESLEALLRRSGKSVLSREQIAIDVNDFKVIIPRLIAGNPDAIYIHLGEESLVTFVAQLRAMGYRGELFSIFTTESNVTLKFGRKILDGIQYTFPYNESEATVAYKGFQESFEKQFGDMPNGNSAASYDAVVLLGRAIAKCGSEDTECIRGFFEELGSYSGVAGQIQFAKDRSALRPFGLKEFRDGRFVWKQQTIHPLEGGT